MQPMLRMKNTFSRMGTDSGMDWKDKPEGLSQPNHSRVQSDFGMANVSQANDHVEDMEPRLRGVDKRIGGAKEKRKNGTVKKFMGGFVAY